MASDGDVFAAELRIPYVFRDRSLLRKAFTAGDDKSHDRQGHRTLAQLGDALLGFIGLFEGFRQGYSRGEG